VIRTFSINDEPIGRSIDETFRQLEVPKRFKNKKIKKASIANLRCLNPKPRTP
jgi:alkyl hydroperoxide reductase subunit AhpC